MTGTKIIKELATKKDETKNAINSEGVLKVLPSPKHGIEAVGGYGTKNDKGLEGIVLDRPSKIIYETINLDKVEKTDESAVLLKALQHKSYIKDGKEVGNNIAIALDHPDTEIKHFDAELQETTSGKRLDIYFGKNLLYYAVRALQDFCEAFGWWWAITRTEKTTILVEFRKEY